MFHKILIANRGEIACRIIRTARRLGVKTVAVYSEPDRDALHVKEADEAVLIGAARAQDSYLNIKRIVKACKQTKAEAVHPGYGFLSENSEFVKALDKEGIAFIGPGEKAIAAMGDKMTAKRLAEKAKVNIIPGHDGIIKDADAAVKAAEEIGYPVMLKASAGGGGKGMRIARNERECRSGFTRATREATASFADGRLLIEKFIDSPHHIEIQLIADQHGNVIALNERECSLQRRHQKVIEEAPSPFISAKTRAAMNTQAVALAKAVNYCSAGTVEFIVDSKQRFYFLEMNTRLQVEHPVTEMTTGLDLVELMLRVACGEKLPLTQKQVKMKGHALEMRLYAENSWKGFLPSSGRLRRYCPPPESDGVRLDSGVEEGTRVSMFYDPMLAKLITYGKTRVDAIARARQALDQTALRGIETNKPFLSALLRHPKFIAGNTTTDIIDADYPKGLVEDTAPPAEELVALCAAVHDAQARKLPGENTGKWVVVIDTRQVAVEVQPDKQNPALCARVKLGKKSFIIEQDWRATELVLNANINGQIWSVQLERLGLDWEIRQGGRRAQMRLLPPRLINLHKLMPVRSPTDASRFLLAPMPGLLVSLNLKPGQAVQVGDELAVIEAMKMENTLLAEQDAVVDKVLVEAGNTLEADQPIAEFAEPIEAEPPAKKPAKKPAKRSTKKKVGS